LESKNIAQYLEDKEITQKEDFLEIASSSKLLIKIFIS